MKDLVAKRVGDSVQLRWTTPSRTTDNIEIQGAMTAEICREAGTKPPTPVARFAACVPVRRLAVVSGASEISDTLPATLRAEPVVLLTYRVQLFNANGHSAGESVGALTAAGAAPDPVSSLHARASERGAILEWNRSVTQKMPVPEEEIVDLRRVELSNRTAAAKKAEPTVGAHIPGRGKAPQPSNSREKETEVTDLRAANLIDSNQNGKNGTTGTVDDTAAMGDTYTYVAERVRSVSVGSHTLEIFSEPSQVVTVEMRDTFPPRSPTGLAAISGHPKSETAASVVRAGAYVDLSWEPNAEPDLAGYRVYRQLASPDSSPQGPLMRLTALPLSAPAYRDIAVAPGQGYIYSVTAVDAAGNESAPSAKTLETISPEQQGP